MSSPTTPDAAAPIDPVTGAPTGDAGTPTEPDRLRELAAGVGRDSAYLLAALPVAIASFTVLITGLSLAVGLAVVWVGVPIGGATLVVATWFGELERRRLAARGTELAPVAYAPVTGLGLRAQLQRMSDPRRWAAVLHGIGALALAVVTWSVAITWWAGTLGGLTYWFWQRWLPADEQGLADLLHLPVSDSVVNLALGVVFLVTLPVVLRGCTAVHVGWAEALLTGASRRALQAQVGDLTARREAASAAETAALRRLERDLHDGPQQRLVRLGMDLSAAERRLADDPQEAQRLLAEARAQAAETLAELRTLSRGIAPPVLADRGLAAALTPVAARCTVPTEVEVAIPDRPSPATETAAYFVVTEALVNVAKHAHASGASVRVEPLDRDGVRVLQVEVRDDGAGGADEAKGHGLAGLAARVEGLGGTFSVSSPAGGPTVVRATLPWQ